MSDLAVLIPVLGRPHRVAPLVASIRASTPGDPRIVFICTPDDHAERQAVDDAGLRPLLVNGNYATKINHGVQATSEPLVFLGADDLAFHPGWLRAAQKLLSDTIGVVGTQDLCNERVIRGEHATHFLMARWYAELPCIDGRPGPLCDLYPHEWVDDELVATARHRDAWAFAGDAIVEHLHPDAGKAPMDGIYAGRRLRMRDGRKIFIRRRPLWT